MGLKSLEILAEEACCAALSNLSGSKATVASAGLLQAYLRHHVLTRLTEGVNLTEDEEKCAIEAYRRLRRLQDDGAVSKYLVSNQLLPEDFRILACLPAKNEILAIQHFEAQTQACFLERKSLLDRVIYRVIAVEHQGLAREVFLRANESEEPFISLVDRFSQGPERSTNGLVGPLPVGSCHPVIATQLRHLTPGSISAPFRINRWWLILQLESLVPARLDEQLVKQLSMELFDTWLNACIHSVLSSVQLQHN